MITIDALYYDVDDFNKAFYPEWERLELSNGSKKRRRKGIMSHSELMTILIHFHQSHYKDFKSYYLYHVHQHLRNEFPQLLSYTQFLGGLCHQYWFPCVLTLPIVRENQQALFLLMPPVLKFAITFVFPGIKSLMV